MLLYDSPRFSQLFNVHHSVRTNFASIIRSDWLSLIAFNLLDVKKNLIDCRCIIYIQICLVLLSFLFFWNVMLLWNIILIFLPLQFFNNKVLYPLLTLFSVLKIQKSFFVFFTHFSTIQIWKITHTSNGHVPFLIRWNSTTCKLYQFGLQLYLRLLYLLKRNQTTISTCNLIECVYKLVFLKNFTNWILIS